LTRKKEKIFLSLEKIAGGTGEDEDEIIFHLNKEKGIHVTDIITPSLGLNQITVWVLKPYTDEEYQKLKLLFTSRFSPHLINTILLRTEKDGKPYISYPEFIENWQVYDDIFEVLNEEHGIKCNDFNETEWVEIYSTEEWRSCWIQTAREIVAYNIKYYN